MPKIVLFFFCAAIGFISLNGCSRRHQALSSKSIFISKAGPVSEADLGLPVFPGAAVQANQSYSTTQNQAHPSKGTTAVTLTASAGVDEVEQFYREKLGPSAHINTYSSGGGKLVNILWEDRAHKTQIQISPLASGQGSIIVIVAQSL